MANAYECDIEIRSLEKKVKDFAYRRGHDTQRVFDSLMDYIIGFLDIEGKPILDWRYKTEETDFFGDMMGEYFNIMNVQTKKRLWYDAWGDLFMSLHPKGGDKGQFFTPDDICNLMTAITYRKDNEPEARHLTRFGMRTVVSDPTAGSSRNLMAVHGEFIKNGWKKPYISAEDVDLECCKMSVINLCVHGCFGEVVCHDTLTEPDKVRVGFIINESLLTHGVPGIRMVSDPKEFLCTGLWMRRKNENVQQTESSRKVEVHPLKDEKPNGKEKKEAIQLTIW